MICTLWNVLTFESNSTPTPRKARLARIQRRGLNMQQFASSEGIVGDQLTKLGLVGAGHGAHFHAIREDEERRHRLNLVFLGDFRRFVDVNFGEDAFVLHLLGHGHDLRGDHLAGAAPLRVEIHDQQLVFLRRVGDQRLEVIQFNHFFHHFDGWVRVFWGVSEKTI